MIFSIDNLKNLNESKIEEDYNNRSIIVDEDSSFFLESLNMILEENKSDAISMIISKKISSLAVANPSEALSIIDAKLEKFVFNIEKLLKKFEATMNRLGSRTSLMKSYTLKDFTSTKSTIKYPNTLCNYTNIGIYNQYSSFETQLSDIYSILIRNLEKFGKIKTSNDFDKLYSTISKDRDISIGDEYRSNILGKKYSINDDTNTNNNFYSELKKYFTGDGDESEFKGRELTPKLISSYAKIFYSNYNLIAIKKECKEIISAANEIRSNIKKIKLDSYISLASNKQDWYSHSAKTTFDSIVNDALYRTQILCNVYLRYIAAKMEAAVNSRYQDIKVLKYILRHKDDEDKGGNKK